MTANILPCTGQIPKVAHDLSPDVTSAMAENTAETHGKFKTTLEFHTSMMSILKTQKVRAGELAYAR